MWWNIDIGTWLRLAASYPDRDCILCRREESLQESHTLRPSRQTTAKRSQLATKVYLRESFRSPKGAHIVLPFLRHSLTITGDIHGILLLHDFRMHGISLAQKKDRKRISSCFRPLNLHIHGRIFVIETVKYIQAFLQQFHFTSLDEKYQIRKRRPKKMQTVFFFLPQ